MNQVNISRKDLMSVESPGRYVGGEYGSVIKEDILNQLKETGTCKEVRAAFCFPDVYEIGMSNLAMQILYKCLNDLDYCWCERVFSPWVDMDKVMREQGYTLYSMETKSPLHDFDIVAFTLGYEMCYTNVLQMLDLGKIPFRTCERKETDPLVICGGPCAYNIEPMADFFDIALMGEGEELIQEVAYEVKKYKDSGKTDRHGLLVELSKIEGVYVPSFYEPKYENGRYAGLVKLEETAPDSIKKRIITDLDKVSYPTDPVIPNIRIIHDRAYLEIFRGCIRGCRFCQAGFIYRPVREKSPETLCRQGIEIEHNTGYDELGILSLSSSDYTGLHELTDGLLDAFEGRHTSLSLPSLRIDNFALDLMEKVSKTRKTGLTFAPEAGTQRLRDVINKGICEDDIMKSLRLAFAGGWSTVKLYFMLGLPTETMDDVKGIADLAYKIERLYFDVCKEQGIKARKPEITVSTSMYIPKPFTPFQWEEQNNKEEFIQKQSYLRSLIKSRNIKYIWHDVETSLWESILARGDRRLCDVIEEGYRRGCFYDAWDDHFKYDVWMDTLTSHGLTWEMFARGFDVDDEHLPWEHIDVGVNMSFFKRERERAYKEQITPPCREKCSGCGAQCFGVGECYAAK